MCIYVCMRVYVCLFAYIYLYMCVCLYVHMCLYSPASDLATGVPVSGASPDPDDR